MKLEKVRVRLWRNFIDSGWVEIDSKVTCLVGKNESGKTAFLEALYRLNPAQIHNATTDVTLDYPRWRMVEDRRKNMIENEKFIIGVFSLDSSDFEILNEIFDEELPTSVRIEAARSYDNNLHISLIFDEKKITTELINKFDLDINPDEVDTLDDILTALETLSKTDRGIRKLKSHISTLKKLAKSTLENQQKEEVFKLIPKFFYFNQYDQLKGRIDLQELASKSREQLTGDLMTAVSLLDLADVSAKELLESQSYEARKAELEATAASITNQVFKYWTQNKALRTEFEVEYEFNTQGSQTAVRRFLNIRLRDMRHHMTTNIDTRSSGFRWFFSFLAAFSSFKERPDVIVLLDEPGLSLHGRAQADFLRFVEEELANNFQVLYTTHSPFMVDPKRLERVRVVEDKTTEDSIPEGAMVSNDPLSHDPDTIFPLQGALGYDLAQNLFIGASEHLVVEGISDYIYLYTLSEFLHAHGRTGLSDKFSIVPVGGMANVPTFLALLGAHLDVTVLVDSSTKGMQRITDMINKGLLSESRLVTINQVIDLREASIEDLFEPSEFIELYNESFNTSVKIEELDGGGSIIKQIERKTERKGYHRVVADYFLRNKDKILPKLSKNTLDRFEKLYKLLNETINLANDSKIQALKKVLQVQ